MTHDPLRYLPLLSPRSPSYARARTETGSKGSSDSVSAASLHRLVEVEDDASRAYRHIALDTEDPTLREVASRLASMHAERALLVAELVQLLGDSSPASDESRASVINRD